MNMLIKSDEPDAMTYECIEEREDMPEEFKSDWWSSKQRSSWVQSSS